MIKSKGPKKMLTNILQSKFVQLLNSMNVKILNNLAISIIKAFKEGCEIYCMYCLSI